MGQEVDKAAIHLTVLLNRVEDTYRSFSIVK